MALYIGICLLCGLYLLCVYRLPHDTPLDSLGVPRMLIALLFLGLGFYLVPSAFKVNEEGKRQRPRGAVFSWLDSFLLTEDHLNFIGDLDEALKLAEKTPGKRIFLDFTGKTCTNCKLNEKDVFPRPEIKERMDKYVLVALYTDIVPAYLYPPKERSKLTLSRQNEDAKKNLEFQREHFGTEQLPLYAVVEPDGKGGWRKVAVYDEGKINDVAAFEAFLSDGLTAVAR
jgi:thiol:disulfide interchange protein DsbD